METRLHANHDVTHGVCDGSVGADCMIAACPSQVTAQSHFTAQATCRIKLIEHVASYIRDPRFVFPISIPLPFKSQGSVAVQLTQPEPDEKGFTKLEFVRFESGEWISDGDKRSIPLAASISSGRTDPASQNDRVLIIDVSTGEFAPKKIYSSEAEAFAQLDEGVEVVPENQISVRVSPRAFGRTGETDQPRAGLLGHMLPIRICGEENYKFLFLKGRVGYEVFLDRAEVTFLDHPVFGKVMRARLGTSRASVWKVKKPEGREDRKIPRTVGVEVIADLPTIDTSTRRISWKIRDFALRIETWLGFVRVRVDRRDLQASLNAALLELDPLPATMPVELPECIDLGSDSFHADPPCADGTTKGHMALHGKHLLPVFTPMFSEMKQDLTQDGTAIFSLPVKLQDISATSAAPGEITRQQ